MADPARWARIREILERAAELPAAERATFVEREATGDSDLREWILAMLEADAVADEFLEESPTTGARWEGRRFGAYEVVGELGRGGMGVVLLGRRAAGRYERDVALEIVPAALVQTQAESRFRSEVRILGGLDHPNIARLLDAGETDEGLADWSAMREAGVLAAGEEAIWADFEEMMPEACGDEAPPGG